MRYSRLSLTAALALCLPFGGLPDAALASDPLPQPAGEVILTVSGSVGVTNADGAAMLDLAMLQAMAPVTVETTTIWTEGTQSFTGVPLRTLLDRLDATGTTVAASALNDYTVEIPVSDAVEDGPILAYAVDGKQLSVRDKGPLWIIYPYDSKSEYQAEVIYSRSIWQLARLELRP